MFFVKKLFIVVVGNRTEEQIIYQSKSTIWFSIFDYLTNSKKNLALNFFFII